MSQIPFNNHQAFKKPANAKPLKPFEHLLQLGTRGHFPLFEKSWLEFLTEENFYLPEKKISTELLNKIKTGLGKHKTIQRKKTFLFSLEKEDREAFITMFFKDVENQILDSGVKIQ